MLAEKRSVSVYLRYFLKSLFIISIVSFLSSCGGGDDGVDLVDAFASPNPTFVINAPRPVSFIDAEGRSISVTYPAPSTQFRLEIDNKDGDLPITILMASLRVTGPKGEQIVYLNPADIFVYRTVSGSTTTPPEQALHASNQPFIAEVGAGHKTSCMSKTDYFEDAAFTCSDEGLTEDPDNTDMCCPPAKGFLANTQAFLGPLQSGMTIEELNEPANVFFVYSFELTMIGWVGSYESPIANFRQTIQFQSSGL